LLQVEKLEEKLQIYDCKKIMGRIAKRILKTFSNCTKEIKEVTPKEEFDKKMSVSNTSFNLILNTRNITMFYFDLEHFSALSSVHSESWTW